MTTRGCACGCTDADHAGLVPPESAGWTGWRNGGIASPAPVLGFGTTGAIIGPGGGRWGGGTQDPNYRYLTTVWSGSFFVPAYPYEDRPMGLLGPGGWYQQSGSNFQTSVNSHSVVMIGGHDYSLLPGVGGWHPDETITEAPFYGTTQYLRYTRQIKYFEWGILGSGDFRAVEMWDIYELIGA